MVIKSDENENALALEDVHGIVAEQNRLLKNTFHNYPIFKVCLHMCIKNVWVKLI